MAISFPRTDIMSAVAWEDQGWDLRERQELSRQANGITRGKSFGSALWTMAPRTVSLANELAVDYEAMLHSLDGVIGSFYAGDLRRPYPKEHADGDFTETSAAIHTIDANNKAVRIDGLPVAFIISRGDYFSITPTAGTPALYQAMETVTVDGAGISPLFEVRPHLRPGTAVDDVVSFKVPVAVFGLDPSSIESRRMGALHSAISFRAVQLL